MPIASHLLGRALRLPRHAQVVALVSTAFQVRNAFEACHAWGVPTSELVLILAPHRVRAATLASALASFPAPGAVVTLPRAARSVKGRAALAVGLLEATAITRACVAAVTATGAQRFITGNLMSFAHRAAVRQLPARVEVVGVDDGTGTIELSGRRQSGSLGGAQRVSPRLRKLRRVLGVEDGDPERVTHFTMFPLAFGDNDTVVVNSLALSRAQKVTQPEDTALFFGQPQGAHCGLSGPVMARFRERAHGAQRVLYAPHPFEDRVELANRSRELGVELALNLLPAEEHFLRESHPRWVGSYCSTTVFTAHALLSPATQVVSFMTERQRDTPRQKRVYDVMEELYPAIAVEFVSVGGGA
jgi:hypothetical protein